jgi:glycine/D-amino acid oxidase-like deaminating enzyme
MDLRTGTTIWELLDGCPPTYEPLRDDETCDVVIVGAGISGGTIAVQLARAGLDVVLLDRRDPLSGSTLACTALLQYELDRSLLSLRERVGNVTADRAYRACNLALHNFPAFAASLAADCKLASRPSLYLAGDLMGGEALREEAEARRVLGIDATYMDERALHDRFEIRRQGGAILSSIAFELDPARLTSACLADARRRGARIYGHTNVVGHEVCAAGVQVRTETPAQVRAGRVVYATGYEAPEFLGASFCSLASTYALATTPASAGRAPWPQSALIWEASEPYTYARTTHDGRICVGGADEPFADASARDALIGAKVAVLQRKFAALMPHVPLEIETAWAGTFATTPDGLACIGPAPGSDRALFALGYGGNGVLFSFIAGAIAGDWVLGRANPTADLFSFDRLM